jgi:hypothetical protein
MCSRIITLVVFLLLASPASAQTDPSVRDQVPSHEWTVQTLHEHHARMLANAQQVNDARFQAIKENTSVALLAAQRAVEKAEAASEKRFEGVNEFRASLSDQAMRLMPRAESESRMTALSDQVRDLSSRIDRGEGRGTGLSDGWGVFVAAAGIGVALWAVARKGAASK